MNQLLISLSQAADRYPIEEKVLLVSDYREGNNICEALARQRGAGVNLRPETVAGLAAEVARDYLAANGISILSTAQTEALVEVIYRESEQGGGIEYFTRKGAAPGLMTALTGAFLKLRRCHVRADQLTEGQFVNPRKERDLKQLLQGYEDYLRGHSWLDQPGLVQLAGELLPGSGAGFPHRLFLLPDCLQLYPSERGLVEALAGENLISLEVEPAISPGDKALKGSLPVSGNLPAASEYRPGADQERRSLIEDKNRPGEGDPGVSSDLERLPWIDSPEGAPAPVGDGSLAIFQAYGVDNEVREVLRRAAAAGIPLDQVTVAYHGDQYPALFHTICRGLGLGLTVAEGIPATLTGPGQLLQGLIDWISGGFQAATLRELILGGELGLAGRDGKTIAATSAAHLLRKSGIGWGRERYRLLLDEEGGQAGSLHRVIAAILAEIPLPDGEGLADYSEYTNGLAEVIDRFAVIRSEYDLAAQINLSAALRECGEIAALSLPIEEILERVGRLLQRCRVAAGRPEPGKLYLTGYRGLLWVDRPCTFVIGLDAGFPGSGRQDSVLLDRESLKIDPGIPRTADYLRRARHDLELGLATRKGRLTLSYSSFDLIDNRAVFPAALLLQIYRLIQGNPALDYTSFLTSLAQPVGFAPDGGAPPLDEGEWWLAALSAGEPGRARGAVCDSYPGIARGNLAEQAREAPFLSRFDGKITSEPALLDPRCSGAPVSCSALEQLARCPFAYFIRYKLGIKPPDQMVFDPGAWLPAAERGGLLHSLFCRFMRQVAGRGSGVDPESDGELLHQLADHLISAYRKQIPPPSALVYEREVEEIHRSGDLFLKLEQESHLNPLFFEVPFGMGEGVVAAAGAGLPDPVEIGLGDGSQLKLAGKIDRIDSVSEGRFAIWDYKSGSSYRYDEGKPFCQGRRVQHALYALAAEAILPGAAPGKELRVTRSGYLFPTIRGEGERVIYQVSREKTRALIKLLCDIMREGLFIYTGDQEDCGCCDYAVVCHGEGAGRGKELRSNLADSRLDPLRRLKEYD